MPKAVPKKSTAAEALAASAVATKTSLPLDVQDEEGNNNEKSAPTETAAAATKTFLPVADVQDEEGNNNENSASIETAAAATKSSPPVAVQDKDGNNNENSAPIETAAAATKNSSPVAVQDEEGNNNENSAPIETVIQKPPSQPNPNTTTTMPVSVPVPQKPSPKNKKNVSAASKKRKKKATKTARKQMATPFTVNPFAPAMVGMPPQQPLPVIIQLKSMVITQIARHLEQSDPSTHQLLMFQAWQTFPFLLSPGVNWVVERNNVRLLNALQTSNQVAQQATLENAFNNYMAKKTPEAEDQSNKPILNSMTKLEEWKKLHSSSPTPPKYDFSKAGRKERVKKFKKARKEKAASNAAAETLTGIANNTVVEPAAKAKKRRQGGEPGENPYARKFLTSKRTSVTSQRATATKESVTYRSESSDDESIVQVLQPTLDRAARAARRAAAAEASTTVQSKEDSEKSPPAGNLKNDEDNDVEETPAKAASKPAAKSASKSAKKKRKRYDESDSDDSEEWTPQPRQIRKQLTFDERLKLCKAFKVNNGHLNIPTSTNKARGVDDYGLGKWVQSIRQGYRDLINGVLDTKKPSGKRMLYQLEILEEIDFEFALDGEGDEAEGASSQQESSSPKRNSTTKKVWEYRLAQCRQYKAEHGHMNMNITINAKELDTFVSRMRSLYKRRLEGDKTLTEVEKKKVRDLEKIGFAFDGAFDASLHNFIEFKERTGNSRVPRLYPENQALASWATNCRKENRRLNRGEGSNYLTVDRLRKLTAVGFDFGEDKQGLTWEESFEILSEYRAEHGKDPTITHPDIGYWVSSQRLQYNRKKDGETKKIFLTDEREEKLRSVGFEFNKGPRATKEARAKLRAAKKKNFDDRLADFIAWKEEHGHPYVPTAQIPTNDVKNLGRWVARMRIAYKAFKGEPMNKRWGILTAEQALKLTEAGFAFEAKHIKRTPKDKVVEETKQNEDEPYESQNELVWPDVNPFV